MERGTASGRDDVTDDDRPDDTDHADDADDARPDDTDDAGDAAPAVSGRRTVTVDTTPRPLPDGAAPVKVAPMPELLTSPPPARSRSRRARTETGSLAFLAIAVAALAALVGAGIWLLDDGDDAAETITELASPTTVDPAAIAADELAELLPLVDEAASAATTYDDAREAAIDEFDGHRARCENPDQCGVIFGLYGPELLDALEDAAETHGTAAGATLAALTDLEVTAGRDRLRLATVRHVDAMRAAAETDVRLFGEWLASDDPQAGFGIDRIGELNGAAGDVAATLDELCDALAAVGPDASSAAPVAAARCER